jgi:hypothetical protein
MFKQKLSKHNIFYFKLAVRYFGRGISNSTPAQSRYRCTPLPGQPFAAGHRSHCPIKYSFVSVETGQLRSRFFTGNIFTVSSRQTLTKMAEAQL